MFKDQNRFKIFEEADDDSEGDSKDYMREEVTTWGEWYVKGGYAQPYSKKVYNKGGNGCWVFGKDPREKAEPFQDWRGNQYIKTTVLVAEEIDFIATGILLQDGTVLIKRDIWERAQKAVDQEKGLELQDGTVLTIVQVCDELGWPIPEGVAVVKDEPAAEDAYVKSEPAEENPQLIGEDQHLTDQAE